MSGKEKKQFKESFVLSNGLTIAETERRHNEGVIQLYLDDWIRGLTPKYRDERCKRSNEFIGANADGSEDLLLFDSKNRRFTVIQRLAEPGQGQFTYLTKRLEYLYA